MGCMHDDLANCLRAWRDHLDPVAVGPPRQDSRRAPGLRREEVAAQAGILVDYLTRLEQGRASAPSLSVIAALARALHLNTIQAAHLYRLAGHADGTARVAVFERPRRQRVGCSQAAVERGSRWLGVRSADGRAGGGAA